MANVLDRIVASILKRHGARFDAFRADEFEPRRRPPPRQMIPKLHSGFALIAETKRASPSGGVLREPYDPAGLAAAYAAAGAAAISVVTEERFFRGQPGDLSQARRAVDLPLLRKDFLVHPCQVYESFDLGADWVLLIAACLPGNRLAEMHRLTAQLGLPALVEAHDAEDIRRALDAGAEAVGINNRDLRTLRVDPDLSRRLRPLVPPGVPVISESGIRTPEQVRMLRSEGFAGILVGGALLARDDPGAALRELING